MLYTVVQCIIYVKGTILNGLKNEKKKKSEKGSLWFACTFKCVCTFIVFSI